MAAKGPAYSDPELLQVAEAMIPETLSREFNLGLIDIGAAYCHARIPVCSQCPLLDVCAHGQDGLKIEG
jgi:A/G-specific adenine glycosylase